MNAAVVQSFDAPPRYTTFEDPTPGEGEQLVTVTACGLHRIVKSLANGTHYGSTGKLPFIPGVDGAGRLADGTRIFFGAARPPFGTFAQYTLASPHFSLPIPAGLDDTTAAAIANPGMSSWAALRYRANIAPGENVLILGATGISGKLAIQIAKRLGAARVVACGRNPEALAELPSLGADATISLDQPFEALVEAFRSEFAGSGIQIVLDYLWGSPAEAALAAIAQKGLSHTTSRIRFTQIGSTAGPNITLPAATLRSSGVELIGSGFGSASLEQIFAAIADFFREAASKPFTFALEAHPLSEVESLWNKKEQSTRLVFQP